MISPQYISILPPYIQLIRWTICRPISHELFRRHVISQITTNSSNLVYQPRRVNFHTPNSMLKKDWFFFLYDVRKRRGWRVYRYLGENHIPPFSFKTKGLFFLFFFFKKKIEEKTYILFSSLSASLNPPVTLCITRGGGGGILSGLYRPYPGCCNTGVVFSLAILFLKLLLWPI